MRANEWYPNMSLLRTKLPASQLRGLEASGFPSRLMIALPGAPHGHFAPSASAWEQPEGTPAVRGGAR